jgi:hypothetical protein
MIYYGKEFRPGKWHILEFGSKVPIHDKDGEKPLVFDDDTMSEALDRLNSIDDSDDRPK